MAGFIYILKRVGVLFIGFFVQISVGVCQPHADVISSSRLANRLNSLTVRYGPAVYRITDDADPGTLRYLFTSDIADSLALARRHYADSYRQYIKSDWGLKASGGYIYNFSDGFEESGFFYRQSYNFGVDWNLLKEGLLDKSLSARENHYRDLISNARYKIDKVVEQNHLLERMTRKFEADITAKKTFVLQFLMEYEKLARDLYLGRHILWEDFLTISNRKKQVTAELGNAGSVVHKPLRPYTDSDRLPFLVLADSALFSTFDHWRMDSILRFKDEENRLRYGYWREVSLRPYLRYNHFTYSTPQPERDFFSGGISFSVPIPFRKASAEHLRTASRNELRNELIQRRQADLIKLNDLVNAYQAQASRYLQQLHECQVIEEQLRKEDIKKGLSDPEYSPLRTLDLVHQWLEKDVAMLQTKEMLYLLIVRISVLTDSPPEMFARPAEVTLEKFLPQTFVEKSIYVWSSSLRNFPVSILRDDIAANGYSTVLLSIDMNDTLRLKALDLVNELKEKDISVQLMIANNSLVLAKNKDRLAENLNFNLQIPGVTGIHLDIEPHTRDDWSERSNELMHDYGRMIFNAAEVTKKDGRMLSISIPVSYDMKYLRPFKDQIDLIYLMAYGRKDVEYITRKITEEVSEFHNKVVLALSVKDFGSISEMENFMAKLTEATGISRFAVHDYNQVKETPTH
ncbi:MAG TPA: hypothetical protein VEB86_18585 [Chryseosolibacter sp.]|nr:hypothetical protein [Chryseosolibacter sp.]